MVVLKPTLGGERMACCSRCHAIGLCSPVRERSTFYPRGGLGQFRPECRRCTSREAVARQRRAREADPVGTRERQRNAAERYRGASRERKRAYDRERARRRREEAPDVVREIQKRYRDKVMADPVRAQARREDARMARRLRIERETGRRLAVMRAPGNAQSGVRLSVGPARSWLLRLRDEAVAAGVTDPHRAVAERVGVSERVLSRILNKQRTVDLLTVDRMCSRDGSVMLGDLYPEWA